MRNSKLMIVSVFVLSACGQEASVQPEISRIEAIADNYLEEMLQRYPSTATYFSLPGERHDDLYDNLPDALIAWQVREDFWLAELTEIGAPAEVGSRDWVTYGILYDELASSVATRVCRSELWAASTATAWQPMDIESEINRYIARPGQANAYMLGMLEIMKLRVLAEQELDDNFDIREFHNRVLENGSVTLPMLEEAIVTWILRVNSA